MSYELSIVIPCYNESGNIPLILERLREALAGRDDIEVVLVNNGSTDESSRVFSEELVKAENSFARLNVVEVNQGYGFGILSGLRDATGEYLAWTHADMQTDPKDVLLAFEKLKANDAPENSIARGRRRGRNPFDAAFTLGMGLVASVALGTWLHDINAQPKVFHRSLFCQMNNPPHDFSLDLYMLYLAKRRHMNVIYQPVNFAKRAHGEAKGGGTLKGKYKLIKRTLGYIFKLRSSLRSEQG